MTLQAPDRVVFRGDDYAITAVEGTGLFDAAVHGVSGRPFNTAVWRGYVAFYAVEDGELRLRALDVGQGDPPRPIDGVAAVKATGHFGPPWRYEGLDRRLDFTGSLLVGRSLAPDQPYLHMGFRPAWMYEVAVELTFDAGRLIAAIDRSDEAADARARLAEGGADPRKGQSIRDWIAERFSLRRDASLPPPDDASRGSSR